MSLPARACLVLLTALALAACEDDAGLTGSTGSADAAADVVPAGDAADGAASGTADGGPSDADAAGDVGVGPDSDAGAGSDAGSDSLPITSVVVTPQNPGVGPRQTQQMTARAGRPDNTVIEVTAQATWASSRPDVATVSRAGLVSTLQEGETVISASYLGLTGSTRFTVTTVAIVGVTITPATASIARGATQAFTARLMFADNTSWVLTDQAQWSTEHPAVATVSNQAGQHGLVTAVAEGQTTLRATLGSLTGTATLTVTAP